MTRFNITTHENFRINIQNLKIFVKIKEGFGRFFSLISGNLIIWALLISNF